MEINKYIFREYDIRGVYNKDITEEVAYLIGRELRCLSEQINPDTPCARRRRA